MGALLASMTSVHTFFCPCSNGVAGGRDDEDAVAEGTDGDVLGLGFGLGGHGIFLRHVLRLGRTSGGEVVGGLWVGFG